jgi:hypothetical protein
MSIIEYHLVIKVVAIVLLISTLSMWLVNKHKLYGCEEIEYPFIWWIGSCTLLFGIVGVTPWQHCKKCEWRGEWSSAIFCFKIFCLVITVATLFFTGFTSVVMLNSRQCTASTFNEMPFIYIELYFIAILFVVIPLLFIISYSLAWIGIALIVVGKLWLRPVDSTTVDPPINPPTVDFVSLYSPPPLYFEKKQSEV